MELRHLRYFLAVAEELPDWKEAGERTRRWFTLAEAADAVEEEDLADLIRSSALPLALSSPLPPCVSLPPAAAVC